MADDTRTTNSTRTPVDRRGRTRARGAIGCMSSVMGLGVLGPVVLGGVGVLGAAVLAGLYQHHVVNNPGPQLDPAHIRTIIAQESPVYYRDGTTPVGVFFESEHRLYVPFREMPRAYVMGIVAAEDDGFWNHRGIDPRHILRAFRDNLMAGGMVAGGSTLTQQTAKNLYYRPDRSLKSKGIELVNALRLEAHYDKAQILEFYANQFHVTGNGRGLGIAARHFFDKEVDQLTTLESAFLAGLVKAPSYYDPFLGDEARRDKAVKRAHDRTRYVLGRMLEEDVEKLAGPPPSGSAADQQAFEARVVEARAIQAEAKTLLDDGFQLPFRRGTFRYDSSAILDEVARRLSEPPFDAVLGGVGIDDPRNAGLVVVTTLDPDAQREATWALWHHLTEVGSWMEGLKAEDYVLKDNRGPRFDPDFPPSKHEFRVARVVEKSGDAGKKAIKLDLGGHQCLVDRESVVRVAVASYRGEKQSSSVKASSAIVDAWVDALPADAVVLASVKDVQSGLALCDIEVRPTLQGAVTLLQDGEIRAMVGGNDNRNFNRATALRQFGSTWKPLVYHAALRLGWSPDDLVDNTRNVFPFSTTFYYPRPDHDPAPRVSIAWAGVNSENLSSVWLLYHLVDRLDFEQLRELARSTDLAQRPDEVVEEYRRRMQELGILPTADRVAEGLFLQARQEVLTDMGSQAHPEDLVALQSLLYGWGFGAERIRAFNEGAATRAWKLRALDNDFQTLRNKVDVCRSEYEVLARALDDRTAPELGLVEDLSVLLDGDEIRVACGAIPTGYVAPDATFVGGVPWAGGGGGEPDPEPATPEPGSEGIPEAQPRRNRFPLFGGGRNDDPKPDPEPRRNGGLFGRRSGPGVVGFDDVLLDDRLHVSTLEAVAEGFERRRDLWKMLPDRPDLYDPEVLYWHQDFRVLLAMRVVASLAEDYGVQTEIREVLSMPLGANEITLEEATSLYSGLVSGTAFQFDGATPSGPTAPLLTSTALIKEIRDVDGRVLYSSQATPTRVADPAVGAMTADILRNVVLYGTGQRAASAVRQDAHPVPVGGKTGTTNDFRNAAFVGYVPVATPDGYVVPGGFTLGVYVGYDDNRSMSNGRIKLAGASGALPAWIGTAQGLAAAGLLGETLPTVEADPHGWPMAPAPGTTRVPVDEEVGLPAHDAAGTTTATATVLKRDATVPVEVGAPHLQRPPRIAPGTEEALPAGAVPVAPRPEGDLELDAGFEPEE